MTAKRRILICDDEESIRESWKGRLQTLGLEDVGFEIVHESNSDFLKSAISELEQRRKAIREGTEISPAFGLAKLDTVSVLIVDYDLLNLSEQFFFTGEDVAYLARCFSECGFILGVNQFGTGQFDLTLQGHLSSFADLNVGSNHVANSNLWGLDGDSFSPWYWPVIPMFLDANEKRVEAVLKNPDASVWEALGFSEEDIDTLPQEIISYLLPTDGTNGEPPSRNNTTFTDVAAYSPVGVKGKDQPAGHQQVARVCAARISKWLERLILPAQEYLIDAPHLALKFPSLFAGDVYNLSELDKTTGRIVEDVPIHVTRIKDFEFEANYWLNRPAWWWRRLRDKEDIAEVSDPWSVERPDFVFCEDISRFLPQEAAKSFVSEVSSPAPQRWAVNTVSEKGRQFAEGLKEINYNPAVRFTL